MLGINSINSMEIIKIPENEILKKPLPLPYERIEVEQQSLLDFMNASKKGKQSIVIFGPIGAPIAEYSKQPSSFQR